MEIGNDHGDVPGGDSRELEQFADLYVQSEGRVRDLPADRQCRVDRADGKGIQSKSDLLALSCTLVSTLLCFVMG